MKYSDLFYVELVLRGALARTLVGLENAGDCEALKKCYEHEKNRIEKALNIITELEDNYNPIEEYEDMYSVPF